MPAARQNELNISQRGWCDST